MKKFLVFSFIVVLACLIGGLFGVIHDQVTYTISEEYYTKFKFIQFGFDTGNNEFNSEYPRLYVAFVGFLATWWMGIPIGLITGLVGLIHRTPKKMFIYSVRAMLICLVVTFVTGLIGLAYGFLVLVDQGVDWWLPENLIERDRFIAVGSMHNFSYLGGLIGLVAGVLYTVLKRLREK